MHYRLMIAITLVLLSQHAAHAQNRFTVRLEHIVFDLTHTPELFDAFLEARGDREARQNQALRLRKVAPRRRSIRTSCLVTVGETHRTDTEVDGTRLKVVIVAEPPEDRAFPMELGAAYRSSSRESGPNGASFWFRSGKLLPGELTVLGTSSGISRNREGIVTLRHVEIWFGTVVRGSQDASDGPGFLRDIDEIKATHLFRLPSFLFAKAAGVDPKRPS